MAKVKLLSVDAEAYEMAKADHGVDAAKAALSGAVVAVLEEGNQSAGMLEYDAAVNVWGEVHPSMDQKLFIWGRGSLLDIAGLADEELDAVRKLLDLELAKRAEAN